MLRRGSRLHHGEDHHSNSTQSTSDKYSLAELKRKSAEKIASLDTEIIVYTDGSTDGNQENGGAGVYIEDTRTGEQHEFSYPAGKLCSSYGSECLALLKALEWIQTNPGSSTILTDWHYNKLSEITTGRTTTIF